MAEATVCSNIGRKGRQARRRFGLVLAVVAAALLVGGTVVGAPWGWRLLAALPAAGAAVGLLQARRSVCVALAAVGRQEDDERQVGRVAAELDRALRARARRILGEALLVGLATGAVGVATLLVH